MVAEPSEVLFSRQAEAERREHLPVCDDPIAFFDFFRDTREYEQLLAQRVTDTQERMKGMGVEEEITLKEITPPFEEGEVFKRLLWDFYQDVIHLSWNPERWPDKFRQRFSVYQETVVSTKTAYFKGNPDVIKDADSERKSMHDFAARALEEDRIVPNLGVGRVVIRMLLVDQDQENLKIARQVDLSRMIEELPDGKLKSQIIRGLKGHWQGESLFTPERAAVLQDLFMSRTTEQVRFVERKMFTETE